MRTGTKKVLFAAMTFGVAISTAMSANAYAGLGEWCSPVRPCYPGFECVPAYFPAGAGVCREGGWDHGRPGWDHGRDGWDHGHDGDRHDGRGDHGRDDHGHDDHGRDDHGGHGGHR